MASPIRRRRHSHNRATSWSRYPGFPRILDGLVLLFVSAIVAVALSVSAAARHWAAESLAYGWAPVLLWAVSLAVILRYSPQLLVQYWKYWLLSAAVVTIAVGALSIFYLGPGVLEQVSLGGRWGAVIGGSPWGLATAKLLAMVVFVLTVLFPTKVGPVWAMSFAKIWHWLTRGSRGFQTTRLWIGLSNYLPVVRSLNSTINRREHKQIVSSEVVATHIYTARRSQQPPQITQLEAFAQEEIGAASAVSLPKEPLALAGTLPDISLLSGPEFLESNEEEIQGMARLIERTLGSHGVNVKVQKIQAGPRIVRFGLAPGWSGNSGKVVEEGSDTQYDLGNRVRVQDILAREKDLALALKTSDIRIQATITGESLVGVEVPVPHPHKVGLKQVIGSEEFHAISDGPGLPIGLGQNVESEYVALDLTELPHLLIAGATGTGKSVCLSTIVASLMFTRPPEQVRFLMVDPKGVELTPFDGLPHLIAPVILEPSYFAPALDGLVQIMEQRYALFRKAKARNIQSYNEGSNTQIPFVVLIVDELAELMLSEGRDAEIKLVRLAQMGRAAGIHLVLSTQRPTVDVVTGLLKANIRTRIGFAVASQTDSRVILDSIGAESLLGQGDMLLLDKEAPSPRRVQGAFVEENEIERLMDFWTDLHKEIPEVVHGY